MATLSTLVSFNGSDGDYPYAGLIADANGDLFGTTNSGGADNDGTVFEIAKTSTGYASALTTLVGFDGSDGQWPEAGLIADAQGDLFGTTVGGGADNDGTVFEIAKTSTGFASAPTALVSFDGSDGQWPEAGLIADAQGDLFGTTYYGGADGDGTVFEIARTSTGYASAPTTLVSFDGSDGENPTAGLIADANGDLFGTTNQGYGTVFEIAKTLTGYASAPTTLVSFDYSDGEDPTAGLIADAKGDLFGTTYQGGASGDGTVFEIAKTSTGYASAPTTLVSFDGSDGEFPLADLIVDANGDLFGTTYEGGVANDGTAFEIAKTSAGYASAPTTLASFNDSDGEFPLAGLIGDANGDLFGTTYQGGAYGDGTVFEITGSGFSPNSGFAHENLGVVNSSWQIAGTGDFNGVGADGILWRNTNGDVELWNSNGWGGFTHQNLGVVNSSWQIAGTGDFNGVGADGILWRNTNGDVELWNANGLGGFTYQNLGDVNTSWQIAGTGDFNGVGTDGILWRNTNGDVELWNSNGAGGFTYENLGDVNTSWQIEGTGNFNGVADGILWRNTNGDVELWNSNGSGGFTYQNLGDVNTSWQIEGTENFNGVADGILWRNTNGDVELWNSNGSGGFTYQNLGDVNSSWQIQRTGDFTGNGHDSILWRNINGGVELWNPQKVWA